MTKRDAQRSAPFLIKSSLSPAVAAGAGAAHLNGTRGDGRGTRITNGPPHLLSINRKRAVESVGDLKKKRGLIYRHVNVGPQRHAGWRNMTPDGRVFIYGV